MGEESNLRDGLQEDTVAEESMLWGALSVQDIPRMPTEHWPVRQRGWRHVEAELVLEEGSCGGTAWLLR